VSSGTYHTSAELSSYTISSRLASMSSIESKDRQCCYYGEKTVHVDVHEQQGQKMAMIWESQPGFDSLE
jgi:hypothetical protein